MFNKKGNSGSIPLNRLKTYGFPRTDFMEVKGIGYLPIPFDL